MYLTKEQAILIHARHIELSQEIRIGYSICHSFHLLNLNSNFLKYFRPVKTISEYWFPFNSYGEKKRLQVVKNIHDLFHYHLNELFDIGYYINTQTNELTKELTTNGKQCLYNVNNKIKVEYFDNMKKLSLLKYLILKTKSVWQKSKR